MKKFLYCLSTLIILISSCCLYGCNKKLEFTTNFSVINGNIGDEFRLDSIYNISNKKAKLQFIVEDENIAEISQDSLVLKSDGETNLILIASIKNTTKTLSIKIVVDSCKIYAEDVILENNQITLKEGEFQKLHFDILPSNFNGKINIISTDISICEYSINSKEILGIKSGQCQIVIKVESAENIFIEKRIDVCVYKDIYPKYFKLVDNKTSIDLFTNSSGKLDYDLGCSGVTVLPEFTTNSSSLSIDRNGNYVTTNTPANVDISVRYYINESEYQDVIISANIRDIVEIKSVSFYDTNMNKLQSLYLSKDIEYYLEIDFSDNFDLTNILMPNCIDIIEILNQEDKSIKFKFSLNQLDFSDFCIVYENVGYCTKVDNTFDVDLSRFVSELDFELLTKDECSIEIKNNLEMYLFDETKNIDLNLYNTLKFYVKADLEFLDYVSIVSENIDVILVENFNLYAKSSGSTVLGIYIFDTLVKEINFEVVEIKATKLFVGEFDNVLYLNESIVELNIYLDVEYAYKNEILIEEIETDCLLIEGNRISATKYSDKTILVEISCGDISKIIEFNIKYYPNKIECFDISTDLIIDNKFETNRTEFDFGFNVYSDEILLKDEILMIRFFEIIQDKIVYKDFSQVISVSANNGKFSDMILFDVLAKGEQYIEIVSVTNLNLSLKLKIVVK